MARKDARLMIESARDQQLTVLPAVAARMDELLARGLAAEDVGILANPFVVQPDLRLRRVARVRGWPTLDWSK